MKNKLKVIVIINISNYINYFLEYINKIFIFLLLNLYNTLL